MLYYKEVEDFTVVKTRGNVDTRGFKVGEVVEVSNSGAAYSSYWDFFRKHSLGDLLTKNIYVYDANELHNKDKVEILFMGEHDCERQGTLAVVRKIKSGLKSDKIEIINLNGLKKIKSEKDIKRDELVAEMDEATAKLERIKQKIEELEL